MSFKSGDPVWVKLSTCYCCQWWPAVVVTRESCPAPYRSRKKDYVAYVKFPTDGTFQVVTDMEDILPINCTEKDNFLKAGKALQKSSPRTGSLFFNDLRQAESSTGEPKFCSLRRRTRSSGSSFEIPQYCDSTSPVNNKLSEKQSSPVASAAEASHPSSSSLSEVKQPARSPSPTVDEMFTKKTNTHTGPTCKKKQRGTSRSRKNSQAPLSQTIDSLSEVKQPARSPSPTVDEMFTKKTNTHTGPMCQKKQKGTSRSRKSSPASLSVSQTVDDTSKANLSTSAATNAASDSEIELSQDITKLYSCSVTNNGLKMKVKSQALNSNDQQESRFSDTDIEQIEEQIRHPSANDSLPTNDQNPDISAAVTPTGCRPRSGLTQRHSTPIFPNKLYPSTSLPSPLLCSETETAEVQNLTPLMSTSKQQQPKKKKIAAKGRGRKQKSEPLLNPKKKAKLNYDESMDYELLLECSSPCRPMDSGSDYMQSLSDDSDSDLEDISWTVSDDSLHEGGLVWFKYMNTPFWPAVLRKKYIIKRKKLDKVSMTIIGDHPLAYKYHHLRMKFRKDRIMPFSCEQRNKIKEDGLHTQYSEPLRDAIEQAEAYLNKKALQATPYSAQEYFSKNLPLAPFEEEEEEDNEDDDGLGKENEPSDKLVDGGTEQSPPALNENGDMEQAPPAENEQDEDSSKDASQRESTEEQGAVVTESPAMKAREERVQKMLDFIKTDKVKHYLFKIYSGTVPSKRHDLHNKEHRTKQEERELKEHTYGPIANEDQVEELQTILLKYYKELQMGDPDYYKACLYVLDVWVPEAIIYAIRIMWKTSKSVAEERFQKGPIIRKAELELLRNEISLTNVTEKEKLRCIQKMTGQPQGVESDSEEEEEEEGLGEMA